MPNRNQTGPLGGGPRTGRRLGICGGNAEQAETRGAGSGMGRGRCNGGGHGRGHGWGGRGFARWLSNMGANMQAVSLKHPKDAGLITVDSDADHRDLKRQADWLRDQLHQVEERLNGTKKE
jgi:Family of unknown function (DUF5320)